MATIDLGVIKPVFRGAYNNSTAYILDNIVTSGGSSYICILASTGNAVSNGTYWTQMSAAGTNGSDGTDIGTTITTQGDILYRDGSGLQRLAKGTASQALVMNSGATAPEWGTISSGTYSVHSHDEYYYSTTTASSSGDINYIDIAGGNTVNFTPTHVNDLIHFNHYCQVYAGTAANGFETYLMMKAGSNSIGSGDIKINYNGQHSFYGPMSGWHNTIAKSFILKCTGLTVNTAYYVEQAAGKHNSATISFNHANSDGQSSMKHLVQLIHYKYNT